MRLLPELFAANIRIGHIYKLTGSIINHRDPHFFICISNPAPDVFIFVICTSKVAKYERFIDIGKFEGATLPRVSPANDNNFTKETVVNCNEVFTFSRSELVDFYEAGDLDHCEHDMDLDLHVQIQEGIKANGVMIPSEKKFVISGFKELD